MHIYGQLGKFGLIPSIDTKPYKIETNSSSINVAASGIKIIPEARDDDTAFATSRDWFHSAERICFLGFGFDELNVERLGINQVLTSKIVLEQRTSVIASVYGKTEQEVGNIGTLVGAFGNPYATWFPVNHKNFMTLREQAGLLR